MNPDRTREILKNVRQIDACTNRLINDALAGGYHSVFRDRVMDFDMINFQSACRFVPEMGHPTGCLRKSPAKTVQTLTPDVAKQLAIEAEKRVAITEVKEGSLASLAGLQKGDVIVMADRQSLATVEDLEQVLAKAKDKDHVLLRVTRQGGSLFVVPQVK